MHCVHVTALAALLVISSSLFLALRSDSLASCRSCFSCSASLALRVQHTHTQRHTQTRSGCSRAVCPSASSKETESSQSKPRNYLLRNWYPGTRRPSGSSILTPITPALGFFLFLCTSMHGIYISHDCICF